MSREHDWMRPVLEALFEQATIDDARSAVLSDESRNDLRSRINADLANADQIPGGDYADNLLQGLLALRMKFDRDEAMQKLELNLSMRHQRDSRP